jgi:hypothetical protein
MITEGLQYETPDGSLATLHTGRTDGTWNVQTDSSTLWGITTAEAEQHVSASAAAITRRKNALALEIANAWSAATAENEKRQRAAKLARRKKLVPGTDQPRYESCEGNEASAALLLFLDDHHSGIQANVKSIPQFVANYQEAGHTYTPGMPGLYQQGEKAWYDTFVIMLDGTAIPDNLLVEIAALQSRCGVRKDQQSSVGRTKGIYCNCLAWELIRRGAKVGPRG